MAEHPEIPEFVTTAALAASPMLEKFYLAGGGSKKDLRTDLSYALATVLEWRRIAIEQYFGPDRRRKVIAPYVGPERRRMLSA